MVRLRSVPCPLCRTRLVVTARLAPEPHEAGTLTARVTVEDHECTRPPAGQRIAS